MDSFHNSVKILDKPAIFFELLSVGQAIASSDDIEKFLDEVSKLE